MKSTVTSFQKKLTNLNANNKSLCSYRLAASDVDIHRFDFSFNLPSFAIIEKLIAGETTIALCAVNDVYSGLQNELSQKLKKVAHLDQLIFEEYGSKDLCIGWPFVQGKFTNEQPVRCPLLLWSVRLVKVANQWCLQVNKDAEVVFNKSFLLAYSVHQQMPLEEIWYEESLPITEKDTTIFKTQLYQLLKESSIKLHFDSDWFLEKLSDYQTFLRQDFADNQKLGVLNVVPEAVLGQFPQSEQYMTQDYSNMDLSAYPSLEDFLEQKNHVSQSSSAVFKENKSCYPLPIDAWQELALQACKNGSSIVVQGPPGTGKSQLICNLIADYMAQGKNVVMVSQKKTALDVVYQRLQSLHIAPYIGLVHDVKNDRKNIFQQIDAQIEHTEDYKKANNTLENITLERAYSQLNQRIEEITTQLLDFKTALFDTSICGKSIKELYLTTEHILAESLDFSALYTYFNNERMDLLCPKLETYFHYQLLLKPVDALIGDKRNFALFQNHDLIQLKTQAIDFPLLFQQISAQIESLLEVKINLLTFLNWAKQTESLVQLSLRYKAIKSEESIENIIAKKQNQKWLQKQQNKVVKIHNRTPLPIQQLTLTELKDAITLVQLNIAKSKQIVGWTWFKLFSKKYKDCQVLLSKLSLPADVASLHKLEHILHLREQDLKSLYEIAALVVDFDVFASNDEHMQYFQHYLECVNIAEELQNIPFYKQLSAAYRLSEMPMILNSVYEILSRFKAEYQLCLTYFTPSQIAILLNDKMAAKALVKAINDNFETLIFRDAFWSRFTLEESKAAEQLQNIANFNAVAEVVSLFKNQIQHHWIQHIESQNPMLKSVSNGQMSLWENELQDKIKEKTVLSQKILLIRLREYTYKGFTYNRLQNIVTYRDLKHQVKKKKQIWSLRKIFNQHSDELQMLVPCWLMSPNAVSSVFPIDYQIDLLIFDEASQCLPEQALPAMYRAKQIVVVGDAKQLAPYDLYQTKWEDEADENVDHQAASLLDLCERYLPKQLLQGHYRSHSYELIAFSNQYFYNNKLNFLPFNSQAKYKNAIQFHQINGVWENRVNLVEAEYIVQLCLDLITKDASKSIAVICFNYQQAVLIKDLLLQQAAEQNILIPTSLIVKNIENIQGDERDIVLLAIGYGKDKKGTIKAQFGTLNQQGGTQRLNVAITRAKVQMIVITSIEPEELQVEHVQNDGPKLLKAFLLFAKQNANGDTTPLHLLSKQQSEWSLSNLLFKEATAKDAFIENSAFAAYLENKSGCSTLVFTDDDAYFQSQNIKEYHAYKPLESTAKGWSFKKEWSRCWYLNFKLARAK